MDEERIKGDKGYYQVYFSNTPESSDLKRKADIQTDSKFLKKKMKESNITRKANKVVQDYFQEKKPMRKRKAKKKQIRGSYQQSILSSEPQNEVYNTLDLRVSPDLTSTYDLLQRGTTAEALYDNIHKLI